MVFKMVKDGIDSIVIKEYVKYKGFSGTERSIEALICNISTNNLALFAESVAVCPNFGIGKVI